MLALLGLLWLLVLLTPGREVATAATGLSRVTVFGDSAATSMAYDPEARRILGRGIDLRLEVAACRRVGDLSCPYDGERPPNVIERAATLGPELGRVVVVIVGYNDYEARYAQHIEDALATFRRAGVERVLWATLRAERQSYLTMNEAILAAARRSPAMTVLDWNELSRGRPDWIQEDGIHLTDLGAQAMARMISDTLVALGDAPRIPSAVSVVSRPSTVGRLRKAITVRLRASGGAGVYRWTHAGGTLPRGLKLRVDGRIVGVPTRAGTFRLRVRAIDRAGASGSRMVTVRIVA